MENIKMNAVFSLGKEDYPERKRTSIVIIDNGDDVHIGVKAIARVYEKNDEINTLFLLCACISRMPKTR